MPSLTPIVLKIKPNQLIVPNTLLHYFCQVIKVHIAGIAIIAHAYNSYLCFLQIIIC